MTVVQIGKRYYAVPTAWNELSSKQLVKIIRIFHGQEPMLSAQLKLFKILTGISWWRLWCAGTLHVEDKIYLTDFLFADNTLTSNLLPEFAGYYGPSSDIANLL